MAISRAQILKELLPGLEKMFGMTYGEAPRSLLREPGAVKTQLRDVPTETLCDLWMVRWGQRAVPVETIYAVYAAEDDFMDVLCELNNRRLVRSEVNRRFDTLTDEYYYVLEKEAHADR